ncbi:hypothetical protein [Limnobaculum parvum]|uniref:Uncharacterized protein n=1 Tax=Limnobaculum parvum TaxID=2172103 RepID=A0A2Y9TWF8_9GAMM|nr:hypothetical protein [Limnobaculum parvum]AWH87952.1 hypothetical protein HYN51_04895 [Limnobaculum parvum]
MIATIIVVFSVWWRSAAVGRITIILMAGILTIANKDNLFAIKNRPEGGFHIKTKRITKIL